MTADETHGRYEVEVKVRAAHEPVRAALSDRGASPSEVVEQTDTYYDAPDREFAETDEALRIRRETVDPEGAATTRTKLTYKGPLVDAGSKTRAEHETRVADDDELTGILDGLGYEPAATVEKRRERFGLDGYTVTLDSVTGLGEFVEVEAETDEAGIERVRDGARRLLSELGLDPTEQVRTSYLGLLIDASE